MYHLKRCIAKVYLLDLPLRQSNTLKITTCKLGAIGDGNDLYYTTQLLEIIRQ